MNKIVIILMFLLAMVQMQAQKIQNTCFDASRVYKYTTSGPDGMKFHWRPENGRLATADSLNDTAYIYWNSIGRRTLRVFGEYEGCFTNLKEIIIRVNPMPYFSLVDDDVVTICEGESRTFTVDSGYDSVRWQNGNSGRAYIADTTEKVWVSIIDSSHCKLSDTVQVYAKSLPYVNLGPDTSLCGDQMLVLNALSPIYDGLTYKWSMPDANMNYITDPSIEVGKSLKDYSEYSVRVTDALGCTSFDTVKILKCTNKFDRNRIGLAFTPNDDKRNDQWEISGLSDEYPDAVVDVYDRWSRLIYRSEKGYPNPWDGRGLNNNEKMSMNTYYYIIYLNKDDEAPVQGTIMIIR